MQLDLFADIDQVAAGTWQVRDFHGFVQVRAEPAGAWRFRVTGFDASSTGTAGKCWVLRVDGKSKKVSIDADDRITIAGEKYGREHWTH